MTIRKLTENGVLVALVEDEGKLITGPQEALDLAMTVKCETGAQRLVLPKRLVAEEFFILSSGMAGEILQKYVNYQIKLAVFLGGPAIPASRCMILSTNPTRAGTSSSWRQRKKLCAGLRRRFDLDEEECGA